MAGGPAQRRTGGGAGAGAGATSVAGGWRELFREQRLAAVTAVCLIVSMVFPWYRLTFLPTEDPRAFVEENTSAFGAFGWVEGAILLVALAVLGLIYARSQRRGFHLPGGDGTVIAAAGVWAGLLIVYRMLDGPPVSGQGGTAGIQWGIFLGVLAAAALAYTGLRLRAAHRPEPPLPADVAGPFPAPAHEDAPGASLPPAAASAAASEPATARAPAATAPPPTGVTAPLRKAPPARVAEPGRRRRAPAPPAPEPPARPRAPRPKRAGGRLVVRDEDAGDPPPQDQDRR